MIDLLGIFYFIPAYIWFLLTNKTPNLAYIFHRRYFVRTRGGYNDFMSSLYATMVGKYEIKTSSGILGDMTHSDVMKIVDAVNKKGYHVLEQKLPAQLVKDVHAYFSKEPAKYLDVDNGEKVQYSKKRVQFDPNNVISPRYQYEGAQVVANDDLLNLVFDENFNHIAQEYLSLKPILDLAVIWWSAPAKGKGANRAAQMYHHDQDRIKFLKFFFYFNDVGSTNGPHCYVPGSHTDIPKGLRRDGRFTDEEIEKIYGNRGDEIEGKAGSIIAVDTRGLHKGKQLTEGHRLLFQIQYSNSLFGQPNIPSYQLSKPLRPKLKALKDKYQRVFSLIKEK